MFFHDKHLQYNAKPDRPDPLFAKRLQEVLGGQWGEMSVMMQYLFQGWNCRGPQKYRDMLLGIGTEEIAHVEMLATMIAQLLEGAPLSAQEDAAANPMVGAIMSGMNPQHVIVNGLGASPNDSVGFPWTARYITASGNLLADFRLNVTAESQGRLQVTRLYHMTDDAGVRDMLSFLIARDYAHQLQWLAAIEELEQTGVEQIVVPGTFPTSHQRNQNAYEFWDVSAGGVADEGPWAKGMAKDGEGEFKYLKQPAPLGPIPNPSAVDPRVHGTNPPGLIGKLLGKD